MLNFGVGEQEDAEQHPLFVFPSLTLLHPRQRFWVQTLDREEGRFLLCAASNPPARGIHLPFYLDSGGLQPVIHCLSSDISGQYDGVTGRNDTGRNAHSTCGRRESLEDLTRSQASMSCRRPPLMVETDVEGTLFLPTWDSNSFPKS